jgi:protein gp37
MGEETKIQWCHHTWNRWRGCRKVAPECLNCYIVQTPPFRTTGQTHGDVRVEAGKGHIEEIIRWNKAAKKANERRRVFVMSLGDWLDMENVPLGWWVDIVDKIRVCTWLDFLLLTKRPQNFNARMLQLAQWESSKNLATEVGAFAMAWEQGESIPHNVWIGVSAGVDVSAALDIPAPVHFLSCEPMIKPLDTKQARFFDWMIFGGESGPGARVMKLDWMKEGLHFCREHGIPVFVKQMGANTFATSEGGKKWIGAMKDKKGGNMEEWPKGWRIREFPKPAIPSIYQPLIIAPEEV